MTLYSFFKFTSLAALIGSAILSACNALAIQPTATVPTLSKPPTSTAVPTPTDIPGFEGWSVINPQAIDIQTDNRSLIMTLKLRALWFMDQRGVLVYKLVTGNFKITADVIAAKNSDPSQAPGDGQSVQLGGLMARNGDTISQNYVFIVVGEGAEGHLAVETKTTQDNLSKYEGPAWDSGQAELRLCRVTETFNLYKRHIGANQTWTLAESYQRPDLPATLQVGANIYTDSKPDLRVRYENLKIETISSQEDCTTD